MVAAEIAGQAIESASSDLLTIEGNVFRQVKDPETGKIFLVPVKVEAHVNPVSILGGAAAGLFGILAATVAWHGLSIPSPLGGSITLFKGLKETTMGADLNRAYERAMIKRRIRASGGEVVESRTGLTSTEVQNILLTQIGDAECQLLNREWNAANRAGRTENADRFLDQARAGGCPWTTSR